MPSSVPQQTPSTLSELDLGLLAQGTHPRPWTKLGAHLCHQGGVGGVAGVRFAVWAPNAQSVTVIGSFNQWDGEQHPMHQPRNCGIWQCFVPGAASGDLYQYQIRSVQGQMLRKADPYALRAELRPGTASVIEPLPTPLSPLERAAANASDAAISIYEVHPGSWRRHGADGERWLNYRELAAQLIPYVKNMGFTHIELMPLHEYPYDASWGYQPTGLYAATARYGSPDDLRDLIDSAHQAGIGVLLDWVPGHFPVDAHGLGQFDGSRLYEHPDPREGWHPDWQTLIYHFARPEVRNFLVGNARFWIEQYGLDGLRVDAVASMLYRDYSRQAGEWLPNQYGGRENLAAIALLRQINQQIASACPGAITLAEESTAFPKVSHPENTGGLGFSYKWNMGWMHDTLQYMQQDPLCRKHHHDKMTFGLVYAFSEQFVLPLSHDEVVHGKRSLLGKMPGEAWQRFANLRAYYGFMWGHPGKKLLFMGGEFAQEREWRFDHNLDWHLLDDARHLGVQHLVRDLNRVYRAHPALYRQDGVPEGFRWLISDDRDNSVFAFARTDGNDHIGNGQIVLVVCNFAPLPRPDYRIGVPAAGNWRELINTDALGYGGNGVCPCPDGVAHTQELAAHGCEQSLSLHLPPLASLFMLWHGA